MRVLFGVLILFLAIGESVLADVVSKGRVRAEGVLLTTEQDGILVLKKRYGGDSIRFKLAHLSYLDPFALKSFIGEKIYCEQTTTQNNGNVNFVGGSCYHLLSNETGEETLVSIIDILIQQGKAIFACDHEENPFGLKEKYCK